MKRLIALALLLLSACVDPRIGAGVSLGGNGLSVAPVISGGIPGGGRLSYTP